MMGTDMKDPFEQRSAELFNDSVERLDAHTRSRLTQARHAALDELRKSRAPLPRWLWAPAGGLAAAAIVAVLISTGPREGAQPDAAFAFEDLDIVADAENLELLEDVEFYAWMPEALYEGDVG